MEALVPVIVILVVAALTPGPNNVLVMAAGALYLARLGWVMAWEGARRVDALPRSRDVSELSGLPSTWLGVAAFQLLNPKAWILLVTAAAVVSRELGGVVGFGMRGLLVASAVFMVAGAL